MVKQTEGDTYWILCPACDKAIRDLWDMEIVEGDTIECPHCGADLCVDELETVTNITLSVKEKA